MFLYINKYNIKNNLNVDICIAILDIIIHEDYLNILSQHIQKLINKNVLIFYIKTKVEEDQDLYYNLLKNNINEQDNKFIEILHNNPSNILNNLLSNIIINNGNISITSYEISFNNIDDILDNNFVITTYNNIYVNHSVINKIKDLFN
tara:strand:- start:952 stop:1395 length:444 start_codon:yes stop_codon:yes gene_type:complete